VEAGRAKSDPMKRRPSLAKVAGGAAHLSPMAARTELFACVRTPGPRSLAPHLFQDEACSRRLDVRESRWMGDHDILPPPPCRNGY